MNHDDDLEQLIRGSLASRSNAIDHTVGSVDDVHRRVDLRRGRRRHVAAFGATAMLAVGAFALTAVGSTDPSTVPLAAVGADATAPDQVVWRCTGQLDVIDDMDAAYFASCETTGIDQSIPILSVPITTIVCGVPATDEMATMPCQPGPTTTIGYDCFDSTEPDITSPCETVVPTTEFDPDDDDPVYSSDGPNCTPGTGDGVECALIDGEQQHPIAPGDSISSIARRYRLSMDTLVAYNQWPDGFDRLLIPGEIVLIPPYPTNGTITTSTTTTTTQP